MSNRIDPLGEAGLEFYSKVSASISHEIKNSLAVINESAGYLEDVTLMAKKGMNLDMDRLQSLAGTMLKQVQRTNTIIKNMNRLAHSLDDPASQVDLNALIELMINLSERTTVTRGFKVSAAFSDTALTITTHPFFLENLIWLILDFAMNVTGDAKTIELLPVKAESGARISFTGLEKLTASEFNDFQTERVRLMLAALNCTLQTDENKGIITINLPETITQPVQ
ncbi:MAG: sensor histidine kinase [Desulfobacteraceae bacterium]|nr:sensor histidine kinase [Desulfobacteraceae bacterium]MBC2755038.1 sensor histidine kinase [Desulfobacteraceae bacterium]